MENSKEDVEKPVNNGDKIRRGFSCASGTLSFNFKVQGSTRDLASV